MVNNSNKKVCLSCNLKSPVFKYLNEEEQEYFRKISHEVTFQTGETVFKQGSPLTHILCISKGSLKLYLELSGNRKLILRLLSSTDIAGVSGINSEEVHHFSISALETTNTCLIEIGAFKKMIRENANFAYAMMGYINASHLRLYTKLTNVTQKNIHGKVADTLLYMANQFHYSDCFDTPLSRQDIADMSVTTRESTIRVLKEFKDQKIIKCKENHFEILQKTLLEKISKFG